MTLRERDFERARQGRRGRYRRPGRLSGSVNGFYVHDSGDKSAANTAVAGGLATVGNNSSSVRNGLLPGFLNSRLRPLTFALRPEPFF